MERLFDFEERMFDAEQDLLDFLEYWEDTDIWHILAINKCKVITSEGMSADEFCEKHGIEKTAQIEEGVAWPGLFLQFNKKGKWILPLRDISLKSLLKRAGIEGISLLNRRETRTAKVMPLKKVCSILNEGLALYSNQINILNREGKVSFLSSDRYGILVDVQLIKNLKESLKDNYPFAEYEKGSVSHTSTTVSWNLNDTELEADVEGRFTEIGFNFSEIHAGVTFRTNDIGDAAASVYPYFILDGRLLKAGNNLGIKHTKNKTVQDFVNKIPKLNQAFKENVDRMEQLMNIEICYPKGCFSAICEYLKLPLKISAEIAEKIVELKCTAFDIYFKLHEILEVAAKADKISEARFLQLQDTIALSLFLNYNNFDAPYQLSLAS